MLYVIFVFVVILDAFASLAQFCPQGTRDIQHGDSEKILTHAAKKQKHQSCCILSRETLDLRIRICRMKLDAVLFAPLCLPPPPVEDGVVI